MIILIFIKIFVKLIYKILINFRYIPFYVKLKPCVLQKLNTFIKNRLHYAIVVKTIDYIKLFVYTNYS